MSGLLTAWRRDSGLAMPRLVVILAQAGRARLALAHRGPGTGTVFKLYCFVLLVVSCDNSLNTYISIALLTVYFVAFVANVIM